MPHAKAMIASRTQRMQGMEIACDSSSNTRLAVGRPRTIDGQCSPNHDGHYSAGEPCSCSQARLAFCHSLRLSESMGPKPVVSGNGSETEAACWCFPAALSGSTGFVAPFTKNVSVCLDERSRQGSWYGRYVLTCGKPLTPVERVAGSCRHRAWAPHPAVEAQGQGNRAKDLGRAA